MGCRACGSPGGGCQFLGTAATSQVVAEAFGMSLPHSALSPSGEPVWLDIAHRSAVALKHMVEQTIKLSNILNQKSLENAMLVHAAFGGSTNLLLHIPAIAHAAGLKPPTVNDWNRINQTTPRLVDALPNGPRHHPTVQVFFAGGVPEVMLHLREMGLLNTDVVTVSGEKLDTVLDWWKDSERRKVSRQRLESVNVDASKVIMDADTARKEGLSSTVIFPTGNLAPEGSVIKATAIDPSMVQDGVYKHTAKVKIYTSEREAIKAVKEKRLESGDILVYIGGGPMGTGMEETAQITAALRYLPWGKTVSILTDARFSGFSTGACIGHIGPEALAGGPIGKLRDGDTVEIVIDQNNLQGQINLVEADGKRKPEDILELLRVRSIHPQVKRHAQLPDDTRLWAALQHASGGTWAGCIYDVDKILEVIEAGLEALHTKS
jgi:putative YjhG/YagF family dehydratase